MLRFNSRRKKAGFTLIELLVVIAIIGVLASVVLASLNSARRKSRDARRVADIKQLQLALELYFDSNSSYPAATFATLGAALAPTYIPAVPNDPLSASTYRYCQLSATSYHLGADLEESTNPALGSDRDLATASCSGGDTIDGADADGCADATGRYCYDVTP
ncbi:MAG: prepilin-type N-terminal cleavage/methylation domain-containing protein [Candidatus Niyogibacteria bacterium]|nr:prepilin-type N-terminal cleavage/methylation domain-containing protein [Candidatus Niyogibacteria bacterium]